MAKKGKTPQVFIGTSGWSYEHWKKNFYPKKLSQKNWLPFYAKAFSTVEINNTFYHLASREAVKNWYALVSDDFVFSIKASRYITHVKRLKESDKSLTLFFQSLKYLKTKLGPILFQCPPSLKMNKERLLEFIRNLPKKGLYVFEFRHPSWFVEEIYKVLAKAKIALCITDLDGTLSPEVITSDFTYIRLHGPKKAYQGSYGMAKLKAWKKKIEKWSKKTSVYCYFDNDEKGYAIQDAKTLKSLME